MQTDLFYQAEKAEGKSTMSQILRHLQQKSLSTWEAITLYNCTRLAAYVHILRDRGHDITSAWKNHNGKRFKVYELKPAK